MKTASDIVPNTKNPRIMSEGDLEKLKASMTEFGDLGGFVVNLSSGNLVGAHQRLKVTPPNSEIELLKKYKKPTKAGTVAEGYIVINGERFTYREVRWNKNKEYMAMIAANKHQGEWDGEQLGKIFSDLKIEDINLDLLGFSIEEITSYVSPHGTLNDVDEESIKDLGMQWSDSEVRQMVLVLSVETFTEIMRIIEDVKKLHKLDTNTDAFLFLARGWKSEKSGTRLRKGSGKKFQQETPV